MGAPLYKCSIKIRKDKCDTDANKSSHTRLGARHWHRLLRSTGTLLLLLLRLLLLGRHVRGAGLLVANTLGVLEVPAAGPSRALTKKKKTIQP